MDYNAQQDLRRERRTNDLRTPTPSILSRKLQKKKLVPKKFWISIFLIFTTGLSTGLYYYAQSPNTEANLPVIMEAKGETYIKIKPNPTDNAPIPYSNISIYSELEEQSKKPVVEQLLPEPETPTLEAKADQDSMDTPPIEVVHLKHNPSEQAPTPSATESSGELTPSKPSKTRESLNEAMQKTLRNIYNDANTLIVENVSHGKKMPTIEQTNTNLKIIQQKKETKDTARVTNTPKPINADNSQKPSKSSVTPLVSSSAKNYWVEFKPLTTSTDAERMWHKLATHKTAKNALIGVQHKVQRSSSPDGISSYKLSAGPFSKDAAMACCQKLRQAKVNCRVIKK